MWYKMTLFAQQKHTIYVYIVYVQQEKEPHPQINKAKKNYLKIFLKKLSNAMRYIYCVSACYTVANRHVCCKLNRTFLISSLKIYIKNNLRKFIAVIIIIIILIRLFYNRVAYIYMIYFKCFSKQSQIEV